MKLLAAVLLTALLATVTIAASATTTVGTDWYVDSVNGLDTNAGMSPTAPLQHLSAVNAKTLVAGDSVRLARGSRFTGTLTVAATENGTSTSPILVTAYGTGNLPEIAAAQTGYTHGVNLLGDYAILEDVKVTAAHEAGIFVQTGADHNEVRNSEVTNTGTGVYMRGAFTRAHDNYVHDLHMIVNDTADNTDYGAVCFWNEANDNEVNHNVGVNCKAPSIDYGSDGGFVEIWSHGDRLNVHHNRIVGTEGNLEMGGPGTSSSAVAVRFHDNASISSNGMCLHMSGTFSMTINDLRIENNSIFNAAATDKFLQCVSAITATKLKFRDNAYKSNVGVITASNGTPDHAGNVLSTPQAIGFTLAADERAADPLFTSATDLHPQSGSPAIDLDSLLLWTPDFDGIVRPQGTAPDAGAYEVPGPAPTTPSPTPTPTCSTGSP